MLAMITLSQPREKLKNNEIPFVNITEVQELDDIENISSYYKPTVELLALILKDKNLIS